MRLNKGWKYIMNKLSHYTNTTAKYTKTDKISKNKIQKVK